MSRTSLLWLSALLGAILCTVGSEVWFGYAITHGLLSGPLAVDDISQWWTAHLMPIVTLPAGAIVGAFICGAVLWVRHSKD